MNAVTETELAASAVAPRVTLALLEANIASEHYFTASDGCVGVQSIADAKNMEVGDLSAVAMYATPEALHLLTFCVLVLANGFTVTGESACASPENFDPDIGKRLARENAVRKIWPLMGYELRTQLAFPCPVLTDADAAADLAGTPRPDNPSAATLDGLQPHEHRVMMERMDNEDKLDRLTEFMGSESFERLTEREQLLLVKQSGVMVQLSDVLAERIATFKPC